jgi:hypothetical protein
VRLGKLTAGLAAAIAALLAAAAPAMAQNLYQDYRDDGRINPCQYSGGQLNQQLKNLPPDLEQYAPGFADQLRNARGACGGGGGATGEVQVPVPIPVPGGKPPGPAVQIAAPPSPKPTKRTRLKDVAAPAVDSGPAGADVPGWLTAGFAFMLAAALGLAALARYGGDRLGAPLRASFADLGARTADAFHFARDLVRYGR